MATAASRFPVTGRPSSAACATTSPERTSLLPTRRRPVQAVLLAGVALELRGVQSGGLPVVSRLRVAPLSGDIGARRIDRRKLVASDSPRQHFLFSCGRIEPPPVAGLHERHREWPVFVADHQRLAIGSSVLEMPLLTHGDGEHLLVLARRSPGRRSRSALFPQARRSPATHSTFPALTVVDQRLHRVLRRRECSLRSSSVRARRPSHRPALRSATAAMRRRR